MKENLFKKFLSFSYGSGVGLVIGFFTTMLLTRMLSPEELGKASMFTLAISIFMIFIVLGTDQAFIRFFYEESQFKRSALLYRCLKVPSIIAILTCAIILFYNTKISLFLFEDNDVKLGVFLVFGIIIQVINRYAVLIIRMKKKGHIFSILEVINKLLLLCLTILFYLLLGANYKVIIYSTVFSLLIVTILAVIFEKDFWALKNVKKGPLKNSQREILKYSFPLAFTTLITFLFQAFDKLAIKQWSTYEELGLYTAAFKIAALLGIFQTAFSIFWAPICYERFEKSPKDTNFFGNVTKVLSPILFIICVLTIIFKDIIILLLGPEYRLASNIIPFLVFIPLMYTLSEATVIGINFYKKPQWHIFISVTVCVINIIGNWALVPKYGGLGAAISTSISYITFFILRTHISLRYYKVNYGLRKIYILIMLTLFYGYYSNVAESFFKSLMLGILLLSIIVSVYIPSSIRLYKDYKEKA